MNRVVSQPSIFYKFRERIRMNVFRKRQREKEDGDDGDESPAGKRIKLIMGSNPVIRGKIVKALDEIKQTNENQSGAEINGKPLLELLPVEVWQHILEDVDNPRDLFDLLKASSQFRKIICPRSLRFAVNFNPTSNAEEAMWDIVIQVAESCGSCVWNLEIYFGDFSFDFYVHLVHCLRMMPNLKSLRLRLSPVGKLRTSKLIGPQSQGDYLDYSWTFDEMWQFIEDHPAPRLPQLSHLDLDVNEDAMDFLSASLLPAYARQINKFETRILPCLRFTHTLIFSTGLFKKVTELHLKQIQSIDQLDEVLMHLEHPNPPLHTLNLYLTRAVNVIDLLELVEPLKLKTLRVVESVKGATLYELGSNHIRMDERTPTKSTIENLEMKDSRHLHYEFLQNCSNLQCLTVLKDKSWRRPKHDCCSVSDGIAYQLRKCIYGTVPKDNKIWNMIPSLEILHIKSSDNEPLETLKRKPE